MKNVIILGANGRTARETIPRLADQDDVSLTLSLRRPDRLRDIARADMTLIDGDARPRRAPRGVTCRFASGPVGLRWTGVAL